MLHLVIGDEVNRLRSAMLLKNMSMQQIVSLQRAVQIRWHMYILWARAIT
jgi:hypothetical protein